MMEHEVGSIGPYRGAEAGSAADLTEEMDRLALTQALHDVDVANARVIDLTQRLVGAGRELSALREELAALQREHDELRTRHEQMQRSRAFKLADRIWAIRNIIQEGSRRR